MSSSQISTKFAAVQARIQAARQARQQAVERYQTAAAESLATLIEVTESQIATMASAAAEAHQGDALSFLAEDTVTTQPDTEPLDVPAPIMTRAHPLHV
ncbi:hypothetical protein SB768_08010 [Burkholderia sp. SIMBA_043]|uniref:hypothetical protein n=1 Tax=Burkholderia TaxID=32008 RepID=UPI0005D7344D|nr:hypothetical protein [Burkholderia vietnamiensis]AJY07637.1 hypothetical protein AK36_2047 [Burkholderia vietnamiensis LMG 10929]AVR17214.1 hypothetical protein A8H33_28665 [Burkholderia vietnamiensis]UBI27548.1 hypothetical protein LA325_15310 [Burkholderia vietnamiensis]